MQRAQEPWKDEDTLRELYEKKLLCDREIAEKFNCTRKTISYWREKFGIEARNGTEALSLVNRGVSLRTDSDGYETWRLRYKDEEHRMTVHRLVAVAEHGFDAVCEADEIHHENHIPWDNRPENIGLYGEEEHAKLHAERYHATQDYPWQDKSRLERMYFEEDMASEEIAAELGCGVSTVCRWMRRHGIFKWRDEELLRELHVGQGLNYREIGDILGCEAGTVGKWVRRYGLDQ